MAQMATELRKFESIETRFSNIRPIRLTDDFFVHRLRSSDRAATLSSKSESVLQQKQYLLRYIKESQWNNGVYLVSSNKAGEPLGLIRLTNLNSQSSFSWESLIFEIGTDPVVVLDTMYTALWLGFRFYNKHSCGPFPVAVDLVRVQKLHCLMGMACIYSRSEDFLYYQISRAAYLVGEAKFQRMGFFNIVINHGI